MSRLEQLDGKTWQEFLDAPKVVLMLGKTDCAACKAWSEELEAFLEKDEDYRDVRFGKILLDTPGLVTFKKAHGDWVKTVDVLPFTVIFQNGERKKSFAGAGVERLTNRLARLAS